MNTTYYRRIANPGGNNYIEATFDKQVYNDLASSTSTFNVFKLKDSQEQYLEKITVNSSKIDLYNSSYLTIANHTFDSNDSAKIYKITKKCLDEKGLASKDIVVRIFINEDINDLYGLFENLGTNYLKKITFNADTANVTNMGYMFQGASYLTEVEFKKFNSSKVTTFAGMFNNCTSITNLNLDRVSSNSVQLMNSTFEGCSSLETLNISNWNTSNVTDMSYMFNRCSNLKNIQISSNFNVSNVTNMTYMFSACSKLNTIGTTGDTIDLSNFSSSTKCNCSYMFSATGDINTNITLKLGSLNVNNCSNMFRASGFTTVNLNIYSNSSIDTSYMFYIATNKLKKVTFSKTKRLMSKNCSNMFYNCKNITTIEFNLFDTSDCTDMQNMFSKCSTFLKTLNINGFKTSNVTNFSNMFADCTALTKITTNEDNFVLNKSKNLSSMFLNCTSLKTLGGTDNIVYIKNTSNINSCTDISYMFESCKAMTSCKLVNFTSGNLPSVKFMFGNCTALETLNIDGLGGEKILNDPGSVFIFGAKNTNGVFGAQALKNLTINNFNLGNLQRFNVEENNFNGKIITSKNILLYNCPNLTTCTFTNWTMNDVISLESFFAPPIGTSSKLITVDLTGLRTSTYLTTMNSMFSRCTNLISINGLNITSTSSPYLVISGVSDMGYMFNDCSSLIFLNLTGFKISNACSITTAMFNHCEKLTKIDLSGWISNNIKQCHAMFSNCWSLKEIVNIENFVKSKCENPHGMFNNCYELTKLDLSGWDTSNVTSLEKLFYMEHQHCKLELITTGENFKLKDGVDLSNIFNKEKENNEDCGQENTKRKGTYYYPDLGKIIIDEYSGAESKLAYINPPYYYPVEIIPGSTNFKYGKYQYLPNNWQPQIIKRNYILARYDGSLEKSESAYRNFINPDCKTGWDIYVYSESTIGNNITYDNNGLITNINYGIFDDATPDIVLSNSTDYKDGVYWLKICPNDKIENFDNLTELTNLMYLFKNCRNITYVDFSTFKFHYENRNYTYASGCLYGASNLIQCKMSSAADNDELRLSDTKILDNTNSMFYGCTSLVKFDTNSFKAKNTTDASSMFLGCTSLKDGSQFNDLTFDSLKYASYIFNASGLENINITIKSTANIDFYSAFEGCKSLITATVKFTNAEDISRMFYGCENLTSVDFNNSIYLNTGITTKPNIDNLNNSNTRGYGLSSVFCGCKKLKTVNFKTSSEINSIYTTGYVSCYAMFYETSSLENCWIHISRNDKKTYHGVLTTQRMFTQSMLGGETLKEDFQTTNYIDCYIESYCLQDTSYMFYQSGVAELKLDIRNYGYNNGYYSTVDINNMSYMFACCNVLSKIVNNQKYENNTFDLSWLKTSGSCNCKGMFEGTSSKLYLYSDNTIDNDTEEGRYQIENFNKDLVNNYDYTTMLIDVKLGSIIASDCSNMFYHGDYNKYANNDTGKLPLYFKSIDFSEFNITNCTSMENMFRGCIYIKELNLESLNLSSVTNMNYAFYNYVHIIAQGGGFSDNGTYTTDAPLHLPENKEKTDAGNYIINKLSVIRTYTDFNDEVSCNNLFYKGNKNNNYETNYVYTYFDGVFYYKQHASNIENIIPIGGENDYKNPSIYTQIYINDPEKIYNGKHAYIPNNWMGLPIIESDYFLVYYDAKLIEVNQNSFNNINKTIINTNSNNSDNSDIKIFRVPDFQGDSFDWGINPEITRYEFYRTGFITLNLKNEDESNKKFYINSNWKEITPENANNESVYVVLRERSNLSNLFEGCTCNLNIIAGPQTIEISSIKGLFKNCEGLGFSHFNPELERGDEYFYGTGDIYTYDLLDKITNTKSDCLEELYVGCSNIISNTTKSSMNSELSQASLNSQIFNFYPICSCVYHRKNITSFVNLFNGCSNIRNIECKYNENDTLLNDSINDVSYMFYNCSKLTKINKTNNITFSNISNFEHIFEKCEKLVSGADSFFDLEEQPIVNVASMFAGCKKLVFENNGTQSVGSDWNITALTKDLSNMFYNCYELSGVDMSKWDISGVTDMSKMFYMDKDKNNNYKVKLNKVNFVSDDKKLPSISSNINIDNLFNKDFDNAYGDTKHCYLYPYQTVPTTGSFTYVEGNNVKQFLPDSDSEINPVLEGDHWNIIGNHEVIPSNWNASYIISGNDGYVLMVYRPTYTTNSSGKITSFDKDTLLMNSDYYSNSGECRSHINYTTITTDEVNPLHNDELSELYSVAATSTYDGSAVSFETIEAYSYQKFIQGSTETTTIYMRSPYLTQEQVNASTSDYKLEDLSIQISSNTSNPRVTGVFYVANSIKNSRIIAKVKFNEYLHTFCYHSDDANNIHAGIFDNEKNNIKLYKIDFSRSKSIWYGNDENKNEFKTYETKHERYSYNIGLKDCYRTFYKCNLLKEIKFKDESGTYAADSWGMFTKTFTVTSYMFYGCSSLEILNIKCFDTKNVYQMKYMFYGCSSLKTLEFTHAQTINVGNDNDQYYIGFDTYNNLFFGYMFGECSSLSELNLKGFYFNENVIFKSGNGQASLLQYINQNNITIEDVKRLVSTDYNGQYLTDMFYSCTNLQYLMLPDISRFLYRMFCLSFKSDNFTLECIKILIRSLFNSEFDNVRKNAILYCEFDSINFKSQDVEQPLEETSWLFGDQGCTGYSEKDGTILDIMFNMLPNNWTIQPSTNKIFINVDIKNYSNPFYVIKYDENIKAINIYDSGFNKINNEFNIYNNPNNPNKEIYNTYYYLSNWGVTEIPTENKYIYIKRDNSSNTSDLIIEIIFKNYFDNYSNNFDTSYLFYNENTSGNDMFINTSQSELNKITISKNTYLKNIYLHSFGIKNNINEIPKFNVKYIFSLCKKLLNIFNLDILKYSTNIKNESKILKTIIDSDASAAFNNCNEINFIDCFGWDTSNVTNMTLMFKQCNKLTKIGDKEKTLNFSGWNTSNVTNMKDTFSQITGGIYPNITTLQLNLSGWDTSKVNDMSSMFFGSKFNEIIGLNGFITSNVIDLDYIFNLCYYISNINDVENWDVSNVKYMWQTFGGGSNDTDTLINLDLSNWDTSNVEDMHEMFDERKKLSSLKLFKNTTNVKDMSEMFQNCSSLTELDLSLWDTSKVENMYCMFNGCEKLSKIINIEYFKTHSCKSMVAMFRICRNIKSFKLQNNSNIWNTSKVTNMNQMFLGCESLNDINISGWNTDSVTDMGDMFSRCRALTDEKISHILSNIKFNSVTDISNMFGDCDVVENITKYFTGINGNLVDASGLFNKNSKSLSLSTNIEDIIENAEYIHNMFSGINTLNIKNSNFITYDMSDIKSLGNLFYKTTINLPICFSGKFNMVLGSDEMIKNADKQINTSVNGIFGNCKHIGNINNLSTFDISFGTYYDNNEYYNDDLFDSTTSIFYQKKYLHYFIPTYKYNSNNSTVNYDYSYGSTRNLGGLTNIFNNDINTSILLGDCFNTNLDNSFFKIYGDVKDKDTEVTDKLLICNSENMAKNIQHIYENLKILYKCIVVNLTLDIPSEYANANIDVISEIFTNLLNYPSHMYFDNMSFTTGLSYSTTGRHIITAVFTSINPENVTNHNIFKTLFTDDNNICACITHIVISNSVKIVDTSLPVEFNNLEEVTIYFLPISGFEVDYDPGIIKSLEGNSNNININLIYAIENEDITIPTKPNSNTTYNIKCNPKNDDTKISGYNCYKYIVGDLRNY